MPHQPTCIPTRHPKRWIGLFEMASKGHLVLELSLLGVCVMRLGGAHRCLPSCNSSCILGDLQLWVPSSTGAVDDDDIVSLSSGWCWSHRPRPHRSRCCPFVPAMRGARCCLPYATAPASQETRNCRFLRVQELLMTTTLCRHCPRRGGAGAIVLVLIVPVAVLLSPQCEVRAAVSHMQQLLHLGRPAIAGSFKYRS
jgi:hypothetical protein